MTKKEREGLTLLTSVGYQSLPEIRAAVDWIYRQLALDEKRRRKRGK